MKVFNLFLCANLAQICLFVVLWELGNCYYYYHDLYNSGYPTAYYGGVYYVQRPYYDRYYYDDGYFGRSGRRRHNRNYRRGGGGTYYGSRYNRHSEYGRGARGNARSWVPNGRVSSQSYRTGRSGNRGQRRGSSGWGGTGWGGVINRSPNNNRYTG
ncbi:uncharacterized protein LOC142344107 [Convolutriloba macropyga]|uniref:uncharacterized protein LOC142344107 n=1 Tax=Convolutriloba macropyga TaxID=536237 RepID=UPI003F51E87D